MTEQQKALHDMIRVGPYAGQNEMGAQVCGFCGEETGLGSYDEFHRPDCPWPKFSMAILLTWPEWKANQNSTDMDVRIRAETNKREAAGSWVDL